MSIVWIKECMDLNETSSFDQLSYPYGDNTHFIVYYNSSGRPVAITRDIFHDVQEETKQFCKSMSLPFLSPLITYKASASSMKNLPACAGS